MVSGTEQKMLSWAGTFLIRYFNNEAEVRKQVKLSKAEMQQLVKKLFDQYDPFSSGNLIATTNLHQHPHQVPIKAT